MLFSQCRFFTVVCPRCAPELGTQRKFGGHAKKKLCPQLQNRVGAYGTNERKNNVHKETINGKLRPVFAARLQGY